MYNWTGGTLANSVKYNKAVGYYIPVAGSASGKYYTAVSNITSVPTSQIKAKLKVTRSDHTGSPLIYGVTTISYGPASKSTANYTLLKKN